MTKEGAIENLVRIRLMHDQRVFGAINDEEDEALGMAIEALEQPEIIRCKDCDWWTKQPDSLQGRCALSGTYPTGAFFCGNARKRGEADADDD